MTNLFDTFMMMAELTDMNIRESKKYKGDSLYTIIPENDTYIGIVNVFENKFRIMLRYDGMRAPMYGFFINLVKEMGMKDKFVEGNSAYQVWEITGSIESMCSFLININDVANLKKIEVNS